MRHNSAIRTTIYNKVNAKIERFSEVVHFILMRLTVVVVSVPGVVATYFNYYVLGLGDESFQELPFVYEIRRFYDFICRCK